MSKDDVLTLSWADGQNDGAEEGETVDLETSTFARILIAGAIENQEKIDSLITKNLKGWELNRINKVSLAILRMSVYALLYQKDVPSTIIIDEAIDIAKEYGQDDAFKFVNAVLDNISKTASAD